MSRHKQIVVYKISQANQEDKHTYLRFEYVSDVDDLHGDYDRRDCLIQPKHLSPY